MYAYHCNECIPIVVQYIYLQSSICVHMCMQILFREDMYWTTIVSDYSWPKYHEMKILARRLVGWVCHSVCLPVLLPYSSQFNSNLHQSLDTEGTSLSGEELIRLLTLWSRSCSDEHGDLVILIALELRKGLNQNLHKYLPHLGRIVRTSFKSPLY